MVNTEVMKVTEEVIKDIREWQPLGEYVMVEPLEIPEKVTKGGILIPGLYQLRSCKGIVHKFGKGRWSKSLKTCIPCEVKAGDVILYSRFGGNMLKDKVSGKHYIILRESTDILAIIGKASLEIENNSN